MTSTELIPKNMFFFNYSVYNRPEEVDELLESLSKSDYNEGFEVVIIEDGSSLKCEEWLRNIRVN
jgi:glycosyltransferase involved in cell wall biosynthesis